MTFQEIRDRANRVRGIPLQAVLLLTGAERDRYDKTKWHTQKGTISFTGMKFMNWSQGVGGGGAIDLAMHLNGLDFKAALEWLWNHFPGQHRRHWLSDSARVLLCKSEQSHGREHAVRITGSIGSRACVT